MQQVHFSNHTLRPKVNCSLKQQCDKKLQPLNIVNIVNYLQYMGEYAQNATSILTDVHHFYYCILF